MQKLDINQKQEVKYVIPLWLRDEQIQHAIATVKERVQFNENRIEEPIAIVGFGPSLKKTWKKVKNFKKVISCSGAHKFLIERGIIPNYHVEVDPRDHKIELLGQPHKDVEYLIASTCSPKYFKHLEGYNVKLWHVFDSTEEGFRLLPPGEWAVTGGCDVGLRSITMAAFLGYRNLHIFGLDGNAESSDGIRHADHHPNGKFKYYETDFKGKKYYTTPSMLEASRQVLHELDQIPAVNATFYGKGLTQAMVKDHKRKEMNNKNFENVVAFQKPNLITPEYAELNKQLHKENLAYGVGGAKHVPAVLNLVKALNTTLILDYGCGKGYLGKNLPFPIWEYDPGVPGKEEMPRPADIVVCTDVLEHIEPELLVYVLEDLRRCTRKVGYFVIHSGPASKTLPDGRNTHLIQQKKEWWEKTLTNYFEMGSVFEKEPELHFVVGPKELTNEK